MLRYILKIKMDTKLKTVLPLAFVIVLVLWQRLGKLSEIIHDYGIIILTILCLLVLFRSLFIWIRTRSFKLILLLPLVSSVIPISFLIGNPLELSIRFLIIYSVGTISLFLIFEKELKQL
jgi:hypothetical protein